MIGWIIFICLTGFGVGFVGGGAIIVGLMLRAEGEKPERK